MLLSRNRFRDNLCPIPTRCPFCPHAREGCCLARGVIYQLCCVECGQSYVGHTGRPLHVRAIEHVRAAANPGRPSYASAAFAQHSLTQHSGSSISIKGKILHTELNISRRKIAEAIYIQNLCPDINNKVELSAELLQLAMINFEL